jgi:hypothetical protein
MISQLRWRGPAIHVALIKVRVVNRCALSAHTRPLITILSKVEICPSFAASAAALNRLTFSWGVSPGGADFIRGGTIQVLDPGGWVCVVACGVVEVKRVASVADRGIVATTNDGPVGRERVKFCSSYASVECSRGFSCEVQRFVRLAVPREFLVADGSVTAWKTTSSVLCLRYYPQIKLANEYICELVNYYMRELKGI